MHLAITIEHTQRARIPYLWTSFNPCMLKDILLLNGVAPMRTRSVASLRVCTTTGPQMAWHPLQGNSVEATVICHTTDRFQNITPCHCSVDASMAIGPTTPANGAIDEWSVDCESPLALIRVDGAQWLWPCCDQTPCTSPGLPLRLSPLHSRVVVWNVLPDNLQCLHLDCPIAVLSDRRMCMQRRGSCMNGTYNQAWAVELIQPRGC